ncbi:iron chelate uptake ABC transporter family permease subunit [Kibdelosporangium persicum]|uniref:Hemin transport system permease protein HmuU n=1 Tax=Kibdelosporangium persicum TaxID=2698649 RepID=A0ABX2FDZ8_9PSEU|nr:iron chelate uptake ABC transporter family permease subunit [Kibdelosporangium persicum]NRN69595.1 Hemin transport system permease protein HmuU [Kibdelosporangium persicum]
MIRGFLAVLAVLLIIGSLMLGTPFVGVNRLFAGGIEHIVVVELRAPRLLLGLLAGGALGVAGLMLQESLRNPLAVPELLGVSGGAAAAVTVCVVFGLTVPGAPLLPAVAGAAVGAGLTLLAVRGAVGPEATLLIGAAVSAALQAVLLAASALADSRDQGVLVRYLLGSLTGTDWADVLVVGIALAVVTPLAVLCLPSLKVLRLGDEAAASAGLNAGRARVVVLTVSCLLIAVVVGFCGPIAWIGFLAPQLARALGTASAFWSMVFGALLVVAADLAARTVLYPIELPVGGLTAVIGVAVGILVLSRRRRRVPA